MEAAAKSPANSPENSSMGAVAMEAERERPQLEGLFPTPEAAAREFLARLEAGETDLIEELALTEEEFRESVYPALPAARPERNTSAGFLWELMAPRSRNSLASTLGRFRGERLELVSVDFLGETTDYGPFRVHRDTVLTVLDSEGTRSVARLFGGMVEQGGRFKIYSFVVD